MNYDKSKDNYLDKDDPTLTLKRIIKSKISAWCCEHTLFMGQGEQETVDRAIDQLTKVILEQCMLRYDESGKRRE